MNKAEIETDLLNWLHNHGHLTDTGVMYLIARQARLISELRGEFREEQELPPPPTPPPELMNITEAVKVKRKGRPRKDPPKECAYKFPGSTATCANKAEKGSDYCKEHTP